MRIAFLPVAGVGNPYQLLMMEGLKKNNDWEILNGVNDRFFGILRTAIKHKPKYIHFDWETSFYHRRRLWMTLLNIPSFVFQIWIVRVLFKCKIVWTLHNITPHDLKHPKIHRLCRRILAKNTEWIRLFSTQSVDRASKELKVKIDKFVICPEGSYTEYYPNKITKEDARKKLGLKSDEFVFLYLGLIRPYKGIENLIDSFLSLKLPKTKLMIAGKVVDKQYFERIYVNHDDIIFHNHFILEEDLQDYYNSSNVVVLPFKKIENSGSTILAMSFKRSVIGPKIGLLEARLINQHHLLYSSKKELSTLMKYVYEHSDTLTEIGTKNYVEVEKYKWIDFQRKFKKL